MRARSRGEGVANHLQGHIPGTAHLSGKFQRFFSFLNGPLHSKLSDDSDEDNMLTVWKKVHIPLKFAYYSFLSCLTSSDSVTEKFGFLSLFDSSDFFTETFWFLNEKFWFLPFLPSTKFWINQLLWLKSSLHQILHISSKDVFPEIQYNQGAIHYWISFVSLNLPLNPEDSQ